MSQENVEMRSAPVYDECRDEANFRPSSDAYRAATCEWGWSEEFPDSHGVFRDPQPRSTRLLEWLSQWEDWRVEAEEYIDGRRVRRGSVSVHGARQGERGRLGYDRGPPVDDACRQDRYGWRSSPDRTKALEAAGLSE